MGENDGYITGLWIFIYYSIFFMFAESQNFKSLKRKREKEYSSLGVKGNYGIRKWKKNILPGKINDD